MHWDSSIKSHTCKEYSLSREYNSVVSHDELMHVVWNETRATNNICYNDKIDFTVCRSIQYRASMHSHDVGKRIAFILFSLGVYNIKTHRFI